MRVVRVRWGKPLPLPDDDATLAEGILRKVVSDRDSCVIVQRYERGGIDALFDTSWVGITPEEADYLDSLKGQEGAGESGA